jgi:hypothetical protein
MYDLYYVNIEGKLDWKISPDKMKIEEMECQKASVQYGGRNWIAWFDPNNPIHDGPYIFHGLPGLIVKLNDDQGDFDFNLIKIKKSDKNNMFYLRKGKEINWDAYMKLQNDYYSDPFAEVKSRNIKTKVGDEKGNPINVSFKELTASIQKQMKDQNNPIELNHKIDYK